jgi:hypothetical protein
LVTDTPAAGLSPKAGEHDWIQPDGNQLSGPTTQQGRPTGRMAPSCFVEASGKSEKSIRR